MRDQRGWYCEEISQYDHELVVRVSVSFLHVFCHYRHIGVSGCFRRSHQRTTVHPPRTNGVEFAPHGRFKGLGHSLLFRWASASGVGIGLARLVQVRAEFRFGLSPSIGCGFIYVLGVAEPKNTALRIDVPASEENRRQWHANHVGGRDQWGAEAGMDTVGSQRSAAASDGVSMNSRSQSLSHRRNTSIFWLAISFEGYYCVGFSKKSRRPDQKTPFVGVGSRSPFYHIYKGKAPAKSLDTEPYLVVLFLELPAYSPSETGVVWGTITTSSFHRLPPERPTVEMKSWRLERQDHLSKKINSPY